MRRHGFCGGEATGRPRWTAARQAPNPADRRQRHPAGHRPRGSEPGLTLERLGRFDFRLPSVITEHLGAGYDLAQTRGLLDELGCEAEVATMEKHAPI